MKKELVNKKYKILIRKREYRENDYLSLTMVKQ
jgi:hypothetical protein